MPAFRHWRISVYAKVHGFSLSFKMRHVFREGGFTGRTVKSLNLALKGKFRHLLANLKIVVTEIKAEVGGKWTGQLARKQAIWTSGGNKLSLGERTAAGFSRKISALLNPFLTAKMMPVKGNGMRWHNNLKPQSTSLPGKLCIMPCLLNKGKRVAAIVQVSGVITTVIVLLQLAIARVVPLPVFFTTVVASACGVFAFKFFHYRRRSLQEITGGVGIHVLFIQVIHFSV
eukprot:c12674_g1_i1 orf=126-812(-)